MAVACQYKVPIIVVIVNNGYLSLIRQNQKHAYKYEYAVDLSYDGLGMDFVTIAEGFGAYAERVTKPTEIKAALDRCVKSGKPSLLDIIVERQTDASMGPSLDTITEFA
jgi:tartronate-semialdehyde synthase